MPFGFKLSQRLARIRKVLALIAISAAFTQCEAVSDPTNGTSPDQPGKPAAITDLTVISTTDTSTIVSFTEVDDGVGQPASYEIRYGAAPHPWALTSRVVDGTCAGPNIGTAIGTRRTCSIYGLTPSTSYNVMVAAFRGSYNANPVFGPPSPAMTFATEVAIASVLVTPASLTTKVGQAVKLTATPEDSNGNALTDRSIVWSSDDTTVVRVDSTGLVLATKAGEATITASSGKHKGKGHIIATAPTVSVATVTVSPATASPTVGQTTQFTATLRDAGNNVLTGRVVTWVSSNPAVATVTGTGLATAVGAGGATITATSEGISGLAQLTATVPPVSVATVTVSPTTASPIVGQTTQFTATLRDAGNNVLTGRVVTWASSNTAVATVTGTGLATVVAAGSATITATSEGISGPARLTATVPSVATVTVSPTTASPIVGQTTQFTATLRDAGYNVLTGRVVTWASSNTAVATVTGTGLATVVAAGSATITATSEGISGPAQLTATVPSVATVTVSPTTASPIVGQTTQFTATLRDASNNVLTGRGVTWSSTNAAVATVSVTGLATAVSLGSTTVTATSEGKSGQASVTVTAVPVATVTTNPTSVIGTAGQTTQLTATLRDAAGNVLSGRIVTWASNNSLVATVNGTGMMSEVSAGGAMITATSEGKSGQTSVTVNPAVPPPPTAGEPIYSASNPDHKLHVYENWANHTSISQIGTALRGDGGPPWQDAGIRTYGAVVNAGDGFGSLRYVTADNGTDPPIPPHGTGLHAAGPHWYGGGSPANGFAGDVFNAQGDDNAVGGGKNNRGFILAPNAYLNKPARASVVYEWAVQFRGTNWYNGKGIDINAGMGAGVGRFNYEVYDSQLGYSANCTDPVCALQYSNGGSTPRYPGPPPNNVYIAPNFTRSQTTDLPGAIGVPTLYYKQNQGWGLGAGQFSWGGAQVWPLGSKNADLTGTGKAMWQSGWLYSKVQITKQAPGQGFGNGRIEMWIGKTPGALVKVMDYIGDVGARDAGTVYVDPTGNNDQLAGQIGYYELLSRSYTGGSIVDIGTIRIWSHSRQ